jgi:HK97 family phage portal protein
VEYTPFEFNSAMALRAAFQGDAYAQIMSKNGFVTSLFPMDTHRMTAKRLNGALYFEYQENGAKKLFPADQILHIKGFNDGGILGFALNQLSRTTLAKGVAMDRFGARVFKNGMTGGAVIEAEQPFKFNNDDEKKRFYDKIQESMSGQDNWHRVIGLPYGMKMKNLGVSPKDAQLIEGLTFQVQDISRLTGVPPSLLMELSRSTFTNTEQQMLQFIQLCLGPWIVNIEQRYKKSLLLSMDERKKYVIKFLVDALLRTDLKTQNDALRVAVGQPWMSVNEARDLKELQPLEGEQYNEVALPLNMASPGGDPGVSDTGNGTEAQTPKQDGDADTGQRAAETTDLKTVEANL